MTAETTTARLSAHGAGCEEEEFETAAARLTTSS